MAGQSKTCKKKSRTAYTVTNKHNVHQLRLQLKAIRKKQRRGLKVAYCEGALKKFKELTGKEWRTK